MAKGREGMQRQFGATGADSVSATPSTAHLTRPGRCHPEVGGAFPSTGISTMICAAATPISGPKLWQCATQEGEAHSHPMCIGVCVRAPSGGGTGVNVQTQLLINMACGPLFSAPQGFLRSKMCGMCWCPRCFLQHKGSSKLELVLFVRITVKPRIFY